ncbi:lytic transglycosylase domain-containing protein [Leucobacter sp. M11]|uniref:lytic transglycosylase domain-containing protein n=1 Tax=Leucobacter sp. M11 TaxID=2993565 RepID=UPI002D7F3338|nr:hypothetical protein [Leucobacter sp. M11]MEB4615159.1 hypothetical protein [Leucobacter sp. M11]
MTKLSEAPGPPGKHGAVPDPAEPGDGDPFDAFDELLREAGIEVGPAADPGPSRLSRRALTRLGGWLGIPLLLGLGLLWSGPLLAAGPPSEPSAARGPVSAAPPAAETGAAPEAAGPAPAAETTPREPRAPRDTRAPRGTPVSELVDPGWVRAAATATGIPERALSAYAGAALQIARENPGCGLGWNTLAGIGEVETHHGTLGGGSISPAGLASPAIIGVPLNGNGVAAIPDTDQGRLDGDPVWDRAVGPMQFIPSTWAVWAADGTGDGAPNPNRIDDAALAAGRYLCAAAGSLTDQAVWERAIASYNNSHDYAVRVSVATQQYAAATG